MRPLKLLHLLLLTTTWFFSRHVSSKEIPDDLDKNESQIEVPPYVVPPEPNILEIADKENNAITENLKAPDPLSSDDNEREEKPDVIFVPTIEDNNNSEAAQEKLTIPVFSEWTQQQIQEAEKKLVELTNSTETNKDIKNETLAKHQIVKMRQKNYASPDCGAKVLASNPEAQSTSSVLTMSKDEYLLSPCTDRIWFVVELCDSIQAQRVELANFELFSSPLTAVSISVSNRFPTREWTFAGQFEAKVERDVQVFDLSSTLFGKFVRVDLTYTNTEHYCPLSFFRVFGTSEIEAFEVENEPTSEINTIVDENEFDHTARDQVPRPNKDNLLNRAGAAVMSIVHKAAEVLAKGNGNGLKSNVSSMELFKSGCMSMSHNVLCQHCSMAERNELDTFMSCKNSALSILLNSNDEIRNHLVNSVACNSILGFDLKSEEIGTSKSFIISILPHKYIAAMCNIVATNQKALPLRIVDIPGLNSSLISKKDEVSLKNVSKKEQPVEEDPLCKQDFYATPTETPDVNLIAANNTPKETAGDTADVTNELGKNASLSGDELNIFNVVETQHQTQQEPSSTDTQQAAAPPTTSEKAADEPVEEKKPQEAPKSDEKQETVIEAPPTNPPDVNDVQIKQDVKILPVEMKPPPPPEMKTEHAEIKINGDVRSSNPPESVFLRLSNRIKTLEKNMTLSTQYLEELSRRYKKQIEDLQQSFSKLQTSVEDQNHKKRESDKQDGDDKRWMRENITELNQKMEYMEVIIIVLVAFFTVQTIFVVALFKRISILRNASAAHQQASQEVSPPSPTTLKEPEKNGRSGRKRSKQRMRKISAPNILTQRSPVKNEFSHPSPVLSRTVSAPNKFNSVMPADADNKENFDDMQVMLEENDEILIPGFGDLQINDDASAMSKDLDTASTVSAVSSNDKHETSSSNKSFKFKRRLSSPFQLKKSSMKKITSDRSNPEWAKKAMSESPPRVNENFIELHKSKSFQEDDDVSVKFKKSNSFKKLFKKLF